MLLKFLPTEYSNTGHLISIVNSYWLMMMSWEFLKHDVGVHGVGITLVNLSELRRVCCWMFKWLEPPALIRV